MSAIPLWVVVEGTYHDRAYYDKLFRSIPTLTDIEYEILLAESLSVDGVVAGGKKHALKLHRELSDQSRLRQSNNQTAHVVLFALDRDLDEEPQQNMPDDLHVIYTKFADVEAEILANGDLVESLVSATGTTLRDVQRLSHHARNPLEYLAVAWEEWLIWGLALRGVNPNPIPTRSASLINISKFDSVDSTLRSVHLRRIEAAIGKTQWEAKLAAATRTHSELTRQTKNIRLVAGKWASKYVIHSVRAELATKGLPADLDEKDLIRSMLSTMIFSAPNKRRYALRIESLFEECKTERLKPEGGG